MALAWCPNDRVTMLTSARGEHYFMCIDLLLLNVCNEVTANHVRRHRCNHHTERRFVSCVIPPTYRESLTRHGKSPLSVRPIASFRVPSTILGERSTKRLLIALAILTMTNDNGETGSGWPNYAKAR